MRSFLKKRLQDTGLLPPSGTFGLSMANGFFSNLTNFAETLNKVSSFAQQGEDLIVERLLKRRLQINPRTYKGFYVDIGAYHPISHSTTYLFYRFGWSGICVDVSQKSCELFRRFRPRDFTFHCAIARSDERSAYASTREISLINEAQRLIKDDLSHLNPIDARSMNSLLNEAGRKERIDYLNIDVEGAEMDALEGLDFHKFRPRIVTIEIHEKSLDVGLNHPTARFLTNRGYVCLACCAITYVFVCADELA